MKKLVKVEEVEGEGLVGLLGQQVTFFCGNYIYTGTLVGVNDQFCKLDNASIVYDTGALDSNEWDDAQPLPNAAYIMLDWVESFMVLNKE